MDPWVHIVGGGLSGLSLAASLAQFGTLPGRVLISEPAPEALASKTFSFWFTEGERNFLKPEHVSSRWSVSQGSEATVHRGHQFTYGTRSGRAVLDDALSAIHNHAQIELVHETVLAKPKATYVFDSRPCDIETHQVTQSFVGIEVQFEHAHGISEVGLMERLVATDSGVRFVYLLPLGPDRLLVEYTEFTTVPSDFSELATLNEHYLMDKFRNHSYEVQRTESAHIPMGFRQRSEHFGIPLGARGGMTRDATGYGYRTIRYACDQIAKDLIRNDVVKPFRRSVATVWADRLFLNLIQHRPDAIPQILMQIANRMTPDKFAAFMMNCAPWDLFHLLRAAPARPFTCALLGRYQWI
jgi:lycopene beta-cyclase